LGGAAGATEKGGDNYNAWDIGDVSVQHMGITPCSDGWAHHFQDDRTVGHEEKIRGQIEALETFSPQADRQSGQSIEGQFLNGYRYCGGPPEYEQHLVQIVIPCESGWVLDPGGYHLGLAQFDPQTWAVAAPPESDFRQAVAQGCAVARWINRGIDPGSSAGWPYCWWAGQVALPMAGEGWP